MKIFSIILLLVIYSSGALGVYHTTHHAIIGLTFFSPVLLLSAAYFFKHGKYLQSTIRMLALLMLMLALFAVIVLDLRLWSVYIFIAALLLILFGRALKL